MVRWIALIGLGLAASGAAGLPLSPFAEERLAAHRTEVLAFAYLGVFGNALQLAFFGGLAWLVDRDARGRALGRIGMAGIAVQVTAVTAAFTIFAALAQSPPSPATEHTLSDLAWLLINLAGGPVTTLALLAFGFALVRTQLIGRWLLPYTGAIAAAHLVVGATFAREGAMSPDGAVAQVVPMLYFAWFAAVSVALLRGDADGP